MAAAVAAAEITAIGETVTGTAGGGSTIQAVVVVIAAAAVAVEATKSASDSAGETVETTTDGINWPGGDSDGDDNEGSRDRKSLGSGGFE